MEGKMTPENFVYWLQGMIEGNVDLKDKGLTPEQLEIVSEHLDLVLTKVTKVSKRTKIGTGHGVPNNGTSTLIC